jgi:general stress protein 26
LQSRGLEYRQTKELTMAEPQDPKKHLYELLGDFDTAMLVTRGGGGEMRARPMAVAELRPDADAYFVTSVGSPKVAEIDSYPSVTLTFQRANEFASLSGEMTIVTDRALIHRLWREPWKVWFPQGKDDPSIALLRFDARRGEYWDNSGAEGLEYVFEAVKAYATGETPATSRDQNAKVAL